MEPSSTTTHASVERSSYDEPFTFGRPLSTYVGNPHHRAHMLILRGQLQAAAPTPLRLRAVARPASGCEHTPDPCNPTRTMAAAPRDPDGACHCYNHQDDEATR